MGKRHIKGVNRSDDKRQRKEMEDRWRNTRGREQSEPKMFNSKFEAFYRAQGFTKDEEDWEAFLKSLRSPLPASFRLNPGFELCIQLKKQLHEIVDSCMKASMTENNTDPSTNHIVQLPWYPNGSAFKLGTDRRAIRKSDTLEPLHKWLMLHTECGNVTRQEAVSMVPPLALNVEPHHRCIDMCAAPGSKTSQLLEVIDRSINDTPDKQGVVVANDADTDRAYMLVHQCRRLNSPFLLISTHKGQEFPRIDDDLASINNLTGFGGTGGRRKDRGRSGYFDRVLCDVPCSGDGTMRKSPHIWTKWSVNGGIVLHPLQLVIARRGVELLKPGGLMVYSTCSMSPYEDEAVVAELLRSNRDSLELVDARSEFLPLFSCRPGLSNWHVLDDRATPLSFQKTQTSDPSTETTPEGSQVAGEGNGQDLSGDGASDKIEASALSPLPACESLGLRKFIDPSDVPEAGMQRKRLRATLFPPSEEEARWMHLERCMRCLPHDEDTGGFFVATLRKIAKPSPEGLSSEATGESDNKVAGEGQAEVDASDEAEAAAIVALEEEDQGNSEAPAESAVGAEEMDTEESAIAVTENDQTDEKISTAPEKSQIQSGTAISNNNNRNKKGGYNSTKGLMELKVLDSAVFKKLAAFYGFSDDLNDSLFVREDHADGGSNLRWKTIYFLPLSVRRVIDGDSERRLKVVSAGIKALEKVRGVGGDCEYRVAQEGVRVMEPFVSTTRKVKVSCQDFCNLLGGGLVSYSTLSASTIQQLNAMTVGTCICIYEWSPNDVMGEKSVSEQLESSQTTEGSTDLISQESKGYKFYIISWKCAGRTINVMCSKIDIQSMKHQLETLGVLRQKISAKKPLEEPLASEVVTSEIPMESEAITVSVPQDQVDSHQT